MLLIGYLHGMRSKTHLCEEVYLNPAYRWFAGLDLEDRVPDCSARSKNRHRRLAADYILRRVFEMVVSLGVEYGLVGDQSGLVDGSNVEADV